MVVLRLTPGTKLGTVEATGAGERFVVLHRFGEAWRGDGDGVATRDQTGNAVGSGGAGDQVVGGTCADIGDDNVCAGDDGAGGVGDAA